MPAALLAVAESSASQLAVAGRQSVAPVSRRIGRTERITIGALNQSKRVELADQLFRIYQETVSGLDQAHFDADVFGSDETRLALFHAEDGVLAGFSYARVDRVASKEREHAVFSAGVYFRLAYRGGVASALFGLTEALRFKLREPGTPLAYLTRSASPAVYRLLATTMPTLFPHPDRSTPVEVEDLLHTMLARRGYVAYANNPWVVHSIAVPHRPERLRRIQKGPEAQYYLQQNPDFASGSALLVWIPLTFSNIAGALARLAWRRLTGR